MSFDIKTSLILNKYLQMDLASLFSFMHLKSFKKILCLIAFIFLFQNIYSQKTFELTIVLDSNVNANNISCTYNNGNDDINVTDTFVNNVLVLKDVFFPKLVSLHIEYSESLASSLDNYFFINEKPAKLFFHINNDRDKFLECYKKINAVPIYDTTNKIYKQLLAVRYKDAQALSDLWQKHGNEINGNDSLSAINRSLQKMLNTHTLSFLKEHSQNYFSFWYFRNQVVTPAQYFFAKDTAYLNSLIIAAKDIFPKKLIEGEEGQTLINSIYKRIHPLTENTLAPDFKMKDIKGNDIKLSDFKGRYLLLDFWASWCSPCRKNNIELKKIYNDYKEKNIEIISISIDNNLEDWKMAVNKDNMVWINLSDRRSNKSNSLEYGISSVPHYFLIDPSGKVILNASSDIDKITNKLNNIFK